MLPSNYKRGLDWLNDNRPFFTVLVTNLGHPIDDRNIPTAEVRMRKGAKIFEFAVNEDFLAPLTDEEIAGVLAHEAFHILFDHLGDFADKSMDVEWKRTIAQECICNDNIVDEGIKLPNLRKLDPKTGTLRGGLYYGPIIVGTGVAGYTTKEVYDLIEDPPEGEDGEDGENDTGGKGGSNGHLGGKMTPQEAQELKEKIKEAVQDAIDNGQIKPEDLPTGDALKDAIDIDQGVGQKAGTEGVKGMHALQDKNLKLEWAKLIRQIDPTAFSSGGDYGNMKASWHEPRRKIAYMQRSGIRLPSYVPKVSENNLNGGLKPFMVFALDFSGSIPESMIEIMANLANTVPSTIDIACCTFSTFYMPYDPKIKGNQPVARGGTSFDAISQFISSLNLKQYPTVVALTDGEANFSGTHRPSQDLLDTKWHWLLINRRNRVYDYNVKTSTVKYLADYVEGLE